MTGNDLAVKLAETFAEKNSKIEELRIVVEACPVATFVSNAKGECVYVNAAYQELVGRPYKLCLGDQWKRFLHPDDLADAATVWKHAVDTSSTYEYQYRIVDNGGVVIPVHVKAVPLPSGGFVGYLNATDVSHCQFECVNKVVRTERFALS